MCGLIGIVGNSEVNQQLYDGLTALQHRGQDAAGMVTCDEAGGLHLRKDNGLVRDVFQQRHMQRMVGKMGIGHVRYPTAGTSSSAEAQPMYVNSPYGIALAHNGNLTNAAKLEADVFRADRRHVNTNSDSEILINVFAHELHKAGTQEVEAEAVFEAVSGVHRRCEGAYAAIAMIIGGGIVGFRDCHGIRPLVFGKRETDHGVEYIMASESVALDILGFELLRDVLPGEAVYVDSQGRAQTKQCAPALSYSPCIFEHVYLARPDSLMDEISVYKARLRMGEKLADRIVGQYSQHDHDIDVVIPVPDTARTAALPLAHRLNVKFREGYVKNPYIGRTFIMPGQSQRQKSVRSKHNIIDLEFKDKNVLLVDDSIVRGTTIRQIIQLAREAGARKVYLASAAPPVRYPNVYGIDMPSRGEFIAHDRTEEEVRDILGADWLIYQTIEDLIASAEEGNPKLKSFECSVFDGNYVAGGIDEAYLADLSLTRNDKIKEGLEIAIDPDQTVIELHNQA